MSIGQWIVRNSQWFPDKLALVAGERRFTYAEFNARVNRQVNGLIAGGMQRGDRIAYLGNNTAEAVECTAAAAKGAFVHVPISFRLSNREVRQILQHSGARLLIIETEFAEKLGEIADCPDLETTMRFDPANTTELPFEAWLVAQTAGEPEVDRGRGQFLHRLHQRHDRCGQGRLFQHRQPAAHAPVPVLGYDMRHDSRILLVYPHNSIASLNVVYVPAWMLGATVVLTDARFSAERWLDRWCARRSPTAIWCRPCCSACSSVRRFAVDLSSLQTIGYGSAPMPRSASSAARGVRQRPHAGLRHDRGVLDHADLLQAGSCRGAEGQPRAAARLRPSGVRLRAARGDRRRPRGAAGRDRRDRVPRAPGPMSGYWNDPERTAETIRDGWLHSGDLATVDADGFIYIVDRKKDLIISGGANIASSEVEDVIYWHEAVREAAVVGRPDEEWGERVHAFVSLHDHVDDARGTDRVLPRAARRH